MREVKHYICEICGTEYKDIKKCERCERSHRVPKAITKMRYLPITQDDKGYPVTVDIVFEDGTTRIYKR